ncbi:MAG: ferritin [Candidatus Omnitrophica bacterium]|nr:ferritin [Candidatus Omnitrophota bacterium]
MISDKMVKSINHQINREIYSAYLYMGMSSFATELGLNGVANWFNVQVQEELSHAQKMYGYVTQRGGRVLLEAIEEPPQDFSSALDLFEKTLEHEKLVTSLINDLVSQAVEEKDRATEIFLQWFVTEQVEEEANATELIQKFKLVGKDGNGLLMLDKELSQRVYSPPAAE